MNAIEFSFIIQFVVWIFHCEILPMADIFLALTTATVTLATSTTLLFAIVA